MQPHDLDADPHGGSPQCGLLNERATVGDLMDPEMVVVIKRTTLCRGDRHYFGVHNIVFYTKQVSWVSVASTKPPISIVMMTWGKPGVMAP